MTLTFGSAAAKLQAAVPKQVHLPRPTLVPKRAQALGPELQSLSAEASFALAAPCPWRRLRFALGEAVRLRPSSAVARHVESAPLVQHQLALLVADLVGSLVMPLPV